MPWACWSRWPCLSRGEDQTTSRRSCQPQPFCESVNQTVGDSADRSTDLRSANSKCPDEKPCAEARYSRSFFFAAQRQSPLQGFMQGVLELIDLSTDLPTDLSASVLNLLWCTCSKQTATYSCSTIHARLSLLAPTISVSAFSPHCLWCREHWRHQEHCQHQTDGHNSRGLCSLACRT